MPHAASTSLTKENITELIAQLAQSSQQLSNIVSGYEGAGYDTTDPRHDTDATCGARDDDFMDDRAYHLQSCHRNSGRVIRQFEKQSPPNDYMNTANPTVAHPNRSDVENTSTERSGVVNVPIDQLPLSNRMTEVEPVDDFLHTQFGPRDHEVKPIAMKLCGTFEEMAKSHWDSCASACFESSLKHCVPHSFVKLEKKIVTADGGCNSDGMAWRRYHVPINDAWIALGDEYGVDLRQANVITFAMPTIVATKFPAPVSIVAAPVAKGLFISTNIAAGYHEQDSIMLHRRPDLVYLLHHKANGLPYAAFVDDKLVRERGLRMVSHFDLRRYSDEKAMKLLSTQWKYHDPANTYWTTVEECYTLMAVGHVHRNIPKHAEDGSRVDRAAPAIYDELHNCVGWPPSDNSSSTAFDSHSLPSKARVLTCTPPL